MATQSFYPFRSEQAKTEYEAYYQKKSESWPVPYETRVVETPSARTFVRISGRASDPPLILLAGARGTSLMWIPNIATLCEHYRTYALDTIADTGLSVARTEIKKPEDLTRWLDEVIPALVPAGRVNLVGMSYGGWLASQVALGSPGLLRKVVMLAPGSTVLRLSPFFVFRILILSAHLPGHKERSLRKTFQWLFRDAMRSGEAGRALTEQVVQDMIMTGQQYALPRPVWPTVLSDEEWRRFPVPGLFMVGENEKIYSAKAAVRKLNRLAPQVKTEIIPNAGHDLTFVQADLVSRKIVSFLNEPDPS